MAITLVGTVQVGTATDGGDVTLTFDGSPAEGDVVILFGGHSVDAGADTSTAAAPVTSGYTELAYNKSTNIDLGVWYKVLGSTPDSQVVGDGGGDPQSGVFYCAYVLRGVDTSNVSDATPTEDGENSSSAADGPSITTVTDEAWVFSFVGVSNTIGDGSSQPSGYADYVTGGAVDTVRFAGAGSRKEITPAGAEDPGAYTWDNTPGQWYGITAAIRPAGAGGATLSVNLAGTGGLAGKGGLAGRGGGLVG